MRWRATLVATSAVLLLAAGFVYLARPAGAWQCHVTRPNNVPVHGLYGNRRLAVDLYPVIEVTPRTLQADGWIAEKFPWRGYGATTGTLRITGHRLHGRGKPIRATVSRGTAPPSAGTSAFWATGIGFSTAGCWQVTGTVRGTSLTFVTKIIDPLGLLVHRHRHRPGKLPF